MASIRKRDLLGIILALTFVMIRILLYYLENTKGLTLINPYVYNFIDFCIILSPLTFIYNDKRVKRLAYGIILILFLINMGIFITDMQNTERIFINSKNIKNDVIIEIKNEGIGSEIYVYKRVYGVFSELKDIMYNEGEVAFNTKMKVSWVNEKLLSITYKDNNQTVEKIVYFGNREKIYRNVLDSIDGTWNSDNKDSLIVKGDNVEYISNGSTYTYSANYCDEQNNLSTILYGNYSKPSITIVKMSNSEIEIRRVSLLDTKWSKYIKKNTGENL